MSETRDSIADVWGARTPYRGEGQWPVRVDAQMDEVPERWVQSACVLCSTGCGLDIGVKNGRIVGVRGRAADRANRGRLGPKGLNGWQANNSSDRLTRPLIRRGGRLVEATWDEAMDLIAAKTNAVQKRSHGRGFGFYTTGQLFLEEYYTLAVIGKAGLRTPHMDANTRLCTATAVTSLMETFGADGQPASYDDLDTTDTLFLMGHNAAQTQTVLWMRILDRRRGPNPPRLIVVDPRLTDTAREADLHLRPRLGTNLALMNGILHLIIASGQVDRAFIDAHTIGFETLARTVSRYTPERVEKITGVPAAQVREAAGILGRTPTLVSTALQGVYQSNQATATAVQINNLHLVRGLIGRPGSGPMQMNGQPTSQNTQECGSATTLSGIRNWQNPAHLQQLGRLWNVDPETIPHAHEPTHAMEIFRFAEMGSIELLWIVCTNPAVSMPNGPRIRETLQKESLFVVVQDAFLTETAQLADVVLPAAIWGEKTGTYTNADRTVHFSGQAINPPGEAKSDFAIFLDFARRMDFRDKDGHALIKWQTPEQCFGAWKECSRGRPCDYTGLSYAKLSGGSGIQWPCNAAHPNGQTRLYADHVFPTSAAVCSSYGHDLETGADITAEEYRAHDPAGRAKLKAAEYLPPPEAPDAEYPFWLTTGRLVYHFHTRTKTGRAPRLQAAAPDVFVQMSPVDAGRLGIREGDRLEIQSRRGRIIAPARIGDILPGHLFVPFHYGTWDLPAKAASEHARAANELTRTSWDPVSKQPHLKFAAVSVRKVTPATVSEGATTASEGTSA